jgi:Glycosyltransferase family 87
VSLNTTAERVIRAAAVLVVVAIIVGAALLSIPSDKNADTRDFSEFYGAAQIVADGMGARLYDTDLQSQFISRVAAFHTFYQHPPFQTLVFLPLIQFSYRAAFRLWILVSLLLLVGAAWLLESQTRVSLALSHYARMNADFGLVVVAFLTFAPATTCLLIGQDSMLMLFIYTLVFLLLKRNSPVFAGCVLALGLYKFQLIMPFVLILLARRKWSTLAGFSTVAGLLVVISIAISGFQVVGTYTRLLLFSATDQTGASSPPEFMPNIRGIVYLLLHRWVAPSVLLILVGVLSVITLWLTARRWRDDQFELSFSAAIIATLLTSYHLLNYDLTLLLLPVGIACGELAKQKRLRAAFPLLPAGLMILLIHPLHTVLVRYAVYALMFIPVFALFVATLRLTEPAQEITK